MARKFPLNPAHPERTQNPVETQGEGWEHWGLDPLVPLDDPQDPPAGQGCA